MNFDVIVVGDYCLDLVFTGLDSMPILGTEIEAKSLIMAPGGACNSALALHQLGVKVGFAAEFGNDDYSQIVLRKFREVNFPEDLFKFSNRSVRKITVSLSYPNDRAFVAYYDPSDQIQIAMNTIIHNTARLLIIPTLFYGPALTLGNKYATSKKMEIFMDGNSTDKSTIKRLEIKKALRSVRFYSPNHDEAQRITGVADMEKAVKLLGDFCQTVIIKDGARGCWCCDNGKIYFEPGFKVKAINTTGAGDCFNAGFIKAWLDGKQINECLKWANLAGALSTQKAGANSYTLSVSEIENILKQES